MKPIPVVLCGLLAASAAFATSNIDPAAPFAWSENAGWCNFFANGADGVNVTSRILSGYAWCENAGWLNLGDGTPDTPPHYSNTGSDFGVNNDGAGNLSGYAWGENIGWVNFDTSGSGGSRVTVTGAGAFSGYAWSENIGWINMNSGYGVILQTELDSDGDGLPDSVEDALGTDKFNPDSDGDFLWDSTEVYWDGNSKPDIFDPETNPDGTDLNPLDSDTDGDGVDDYDEIAGGSDPLNPNDNVPVPVSTLAATLALLAVATVVVRTSRGKS